MKTYRIIGKTNGWIAQRDIHFGGKTEIVMHEGMTLSEAREQLLKMYREDYGYVANWGLAVIESDRRGEGATKTYMDGTRSYDFDSRKYIIEQE